MVAPRLPVPERQWRFFSDALSSRAVTLFILSDVGIYDVLARSILESGDTIEDSGT